MHSCLYFGQIRHRRFGPRAHAFRYRLFMVYLDLAELETVFRGRWLWSARRAAVARFNRADHTGPADQPLEQSIRDLVETRTGTRPAGPIRLLTHLRYFGYGFNPVSFYYCFDAYDRAVETIVAEVNNTPWGEQYCYVLRNANTDSGRRSHGHILAKEFHVSPFMPMNIAYDWRFTEPGGRLAVHMGNLQDGRKLFDATLALRRAPITSGRLARALAFYPLMTVKIIAAIHLQALKLWLKRFPVYTHPGKREAPPVAKPK